MFFRRDYFMVFVRGQVLVLELENMSSISFV